MPYYLLYVYLLSFCVNRDITMGFAKFVSAYLVAKGLFAYKD